MLWEIVRIIVNVKIYLEINIIKLLFYVAFCHKYDIICKKGFKGEIYGKY